MGVSFEQRLAALRAVAEETRLRVVALLNEGELSGRELTEILGQSQPRVSRHLKVLTDAEVVTSHREGNYVFFANTLVGREIAAASVASIGDRDAVLAGDRERLEGVRSERARVAADYFARVAPEWDHLRSRHAPEVDVEAAILAMTSGLEYTSVLDLGTGTGRMLALLASDRHLDRAVGVDASPAMLSVARANLDGVTFINAASGASRSIELRQDDLHTTSFAKGTFDLVVIHQVLHYLDNPERAVRHAADLVRPGGHLLIVDVAPHQLEALQRDHAHRKLGFEPDLITGWMGAAGVVNTVQSHIQPNEVDSPSDALTVVIWRGQRVPDATESSNESSPGNESSPTKGLSPKEREHGRL